MESTMNICCCTEDDADGSAEAVMVKAGEACRGVCGDILPVQAREAEEGATLTLPHTHSMVQAYTFGFCPNEALQRGTMFPELVG